ncbi:MAG: flagellar hook protein FlgE [Myxococcales bacterium]
MSILRAMYTGVSGVNAQSEALGVVGDNIANVNTVGFKEQRALFEDILGKSFGDGPGVGVRVARVQQMFSQGALSNTGVSTDVALNGDGFFVVKGAVGGIDGTYFTRAGQFKVDKDGYLVSPQGLQAQGYKVNPDGATFSSVIGPIQLTTAALQPRPTSTMTVTANLNASATSPATWDPQSPSATSNASTSITVYDTLGAPHTVTTFFRKEAAAGTWSYHVLASSSEVNTPTPPTGSTYTELTGGTGTLTFSSTGALITGPTLPVTVTFKNGAQVAGQNTMVLNYGNPPPPTGTGTGLDGVTQFSSPSSVSSQGQDGYSSADLAGVNIDAGGVISGVYTNGQKVPMAQATIAKFRSNEGLGRAGQNLFTDTRESGQAALGLAGIGGRGSLTSGSVEQSNVDLAKQFVNLIQHQRAFQANTKTISTDDEMLQELVNLKR